MGPENDREYAEASMALAAMNSFQEYLQHADAKVATLVVAHVGAVVAVIATPPSATGRHGVVTVPALVLFAGAFLMPGHHLIQALRPRLRTSASASVFGLMRISAEVPADLATQRDAAWEISPGLRRDRPDQA